MSILTLNSTNKLIFNDISQFIQGMNDTFRYQYDEIVITTLLMWLEKLDISGTYTGGGLMNAVV